MISQKTIYKCIIISVLYCLIGIKPLFAQDRSEWTLNRILNADNGLAQNTVNGLYFDFATGFLWIATEGGLVCYNGINTKTFDPQNTSAFQTPRMIGFIPALNNKVAILDRLYKAVIVDNNKPNTTLIANYFDRSTGIFNGFADNLSFTRTGSGKKILDSIQQWITAKHPYESVVSFINDTSVVAIVRDSAWILQGNSISAPIQVSIPVTSSKLLIPKSENSIVLLNDQLSGDFLDVTQKKVFPIHPLQPSLLKGSPQLFEENINNQHLLLNNRKLYWVTVSRQGIDLQLFAELPSLPDNITSVTVHPEKNQLFIGTRYHGLYIYTRSFFHTYQFNDPSKYKGTEDFPSLLLSNFYSSVLIDSTFALIGYLDGNPGGSRTILLNLKDGSFNFPFSTYALPYRYAITPNNDVYLPSFETKKHNIQLPDKKLQVHLRPDHSYYDLKLDRIWTLTGNDIGFLENDTIRPFVKSSITITQFKRTCNVFIAQNDAAVFRVNETTRKLEKLYEFTKPLLRYVFIDDDSLMWMTTYGDGIYLYDLKTKKTYRPKPDSKKYLLFSHCLVDDNRGNFFIPTNNGLFRINKKALIAACRDTTTTVFYHYYNKTNGLLQNEFNGGCAPAYNRMPNGDLLFPSMHGYVRTFTSDIPSPYNYPLFIDEVVSTKKTYEYTDDMAFSAKERTLTWEVNFAQWEHPATSGLSYKVDNEKEWKHLDAGERRIYLSDLTGGEHALYIRNQFDLAGEKISVLTVHFYIDKKYHETAWFWLLIVAALFVIIYLIARWRNRSLRRDNVKLEKIIRAKTLEIQNKNTDLQATLQNLNRAIELLEQNSRFQQRLIGLLGHDIMVPLKYIVKVTGQINTYREKLSEETKAEAVKDIGNTANQLLYLGESLIHWLKLQEEDFIPHYTEFDIRGLADELVNLHQPIAAEKGSKVVNEIPTNIYCVQEPVILRVVLHNLLLNANKFTSKGTITINGQLNQNTLFLTVSDTGTGMNAQQVSDLNNLKVGSSQKGTGNEAGWGLGYRFIIDMLAFVQGKFSVSSEKTKGTTVTIQVPCHNEP